MANLAEVSISLDDESKQLMREVAVSQKRWRIQLAILSVAIACALNSWVIIVQSKKIDSLEWKASKQENVLKYANQRIAELERE